MNYEAFGIVLDSSARFKDNAAVLFMNLWYLTTEYGQDTYMTYCEDSDLDPSQNESKEAFVDSYENEVYCWDGLEGLITDYINDYECNHEVRFRNEDYCIAVPATVPKNAEERNRMLTQEDIIRILQKYFSALLKGDSPCDIRYITVRN